MEKIRTVPKIKQLAGSGKNAFTINYDPRLMEETVFLAVRKSKKKTVFQKEKDRIYEISNTEARENSFRRFHNRWFNKLGLNLPLKKFFSYWPVLETATRGCIISRASIRDKVMAELYVDSSGFQDPAFWERRIVIQITPEIMSHPHIFLNFLRHEMFHIFDMVDKHFKYDPSYSKNDVGPALDQLLQEKYSVLWNIIIDGRLEKAGHPTPLTREQHEAIFQKAFPLGRNTKGAFSNFFDKPFKTHLELMAFAKNSQILEKKHVSNQMEKRGRCPLCHFPSFSLSKIEQGPGSYLTQMIHDENPQWEEEKPICLQCLEIYQSRMT